MALDKSESSRENVSDLAEARRERLNKSSIAYGRRHNDESDGPNQQAQTDDAVQVKSTDKPNVRQVSSGRRFNRQKVDRIKAELESGQYEMNPLQIADLFIDHERHC